MSRKETVVSEVTTYLRRVGGRRNTRTVTADDVQNYLDNNRFRGTQDERLSVTGTTVHAIWLHPFDA